MDAGNVRFIDSLSFFLQPLSALPKAFGLPMDLKKGDFPHLFNTPANYDYIGPLPGIENYGIEYMSVTKADELKEWYKEQSSFNDTFNFKKELIEYCTNDVMILLKSLMAFQKKFMDITGIDPLTRCFTLASIGLEVFRSRFLPDNTLAVTPVKGYRHLKQKSIVELCWLDWIDHSRKVSVNRDYRIGKFFVDGFIEEQNLVLEFFGCKWHGCQSCKIDLEKSQETLERIDYIKKLGYNIEVIWECEYKRLRRGNPELNWFHLTRSNYHSTYKPASIREAFFGGRTNNIRFYHEIGADEEIKYLDFTSLYPFVLKTKRYPIGHPIIIQGDFDFSLKSYFGFVKCTVVPPRNLYLPVLPYSVDNKLLFPLCRTCSLHLNQDLCTHDLDERSITNTWTTEELKKALEKGYKISGIFEVLHFEETNDELFSQYINMWLKVKQEASGWPKWIESKEDQDGYINKYLEKEGIKLDRNNIEHNPSARFIAKIMLNSFWGKLAQRPNMKQTSIIHTAQEYLELAENEKLIMTDELTVNEDTVMAEWRYKDDSDAPQTNTNISVASYVTAWARLELYNLMERIEEIRPQSVLYYDTDSVIYYRKLTDTPILTGDLLGELKDEILDGYGEGAYIKRFAATGPKNYALEIKHPEKEFPAVLKFKGLTQNVESQHILNFKKVWKVAGEYARGSRQECEVPQRQFKISKDHGVETRYFEKVYRATSMKRKIDGNNSFPYGY